MKWLRQQRKVDAISAQADTRARQAARFRVAIHRWCKRTLQQPATLTWAFAAGTLAGAGATPKKARRIRDLLKWVNLTTMVWGLVQGTRPVQMSGNNGGRKVSNPPQ